MERSSHASSRCRRTNGRAMPFFAPGLALGLCCATALAPAASGPPAIVIDGQAAALACATDRPVHGAALAVAGTGSPPAAGSLFRVSYDFASGSGTLTRTPLSRGEAGGATPVWDAAAVLAGTPPARRRIYTMQADGSTAPFEWDSLAPSQQAVLDLPPGGGAADGLGPARLAWLRGERALEGTTFRRRAGLLGDSVHGAPLYIGAGANRHADIAYSAFYRGTERRTPAVYLGANDGMLHAFDAATGSELFAYAPAMLVPALSALPAPDYTHRAYVDGPLAAGEAFIGGAWRSVLVGSPGAGAQGLFALDVTDPAAFDGGLGVLWEFTDRDDVAMGNVMQPAQVARLKLRMRGDTPVYRDFAVTGNGLNSHAADAAQGEANGALFLLALDKPPAERWRIDTNYYRLDTPPGDPARPGGLAAPALVTNEEGVLRHAYAGDLQGRLWRFDFTRHAPWRGNPRLQPVFMARDGAGRPQPITQPPRIVHAQGGGYLLLFGTGSLYGRAERDPAGFAPQSYYAVHDDPAAPARPAPLERSDLAERYVEGEAADARFTVLGRQATAGSGRRYKGWYLDFPAGGTTGERSVAPGALADGKLVFTTVVPGRDRCAPSASRRYVLDALTGLPVNAGGSVLARGLTGVLVPDVVHGAPLLLPGPRRPMAREPTGRVRVTRETAILHAGTAAEVDGGVSGASWPAGRLSWREVANWRQLHRAAVPGGRP
ncbi:PilC/PilY family type IV pilus protein [Massilia sp. METH4]|uniref:pilus assembly protein n=1 Tax=Massilia sp. METH4 TaxID=3123041 RepID=UPI0030CBD0B3